MALLSATAEKEKQIVFSLQSVSTGESFSFTSSGDLERFLSQRDLSKDEEQSSSEQSDSAQINN
ncbi:MAG: hypothetical protein SNJ66_06365 [Chloroherpetonaceae bacterium]